MKKSIFTLCKSKLTKSTLIISALALAAGMTACSDNDIKAPGDLDDSIETSSMIVTSDPALLGKYVTNFAPVRSRSGETDVTYTMPISTPTVPEAAVEYGSINFYYFPDEAAREAAKTSKVTTPTEAGINVIGDMSIYVADKFTIVGANTVNPGHVNIYVLPGGELVLKGNYTNGLPFHAEGSQLTIYNFGELSAATTDSPCNIENTTIHSATPLIIDNVGLGVGAEFYAYDGVDVDILNVYVGAKLYAGCKILASTKITIDSRAEVSTGYVKSPLIELKGNSEGNATPQKLILRDGGMWEADKILLDNVENIIVGSNTDSYSLISAGEISINNIDLTNTFECTYINCSNWTGDNRASDLSALVFGPTAYLNNDSDIAVDNNAENACAPKFVHKAPTGDDEGDDDTPTTPELLVPIAKVQMDHSHPISATCIDVFGNRAFVSWHERGADLKGCVEILNIDKANDQVSFEAWMETPAVTENPAAAYDFNHIIYDQTTNSLLTVGDHKIKDGFVAQIKLDAINSAQHQQSLDILIPRQLPIPASGNAIIRNGDDLYIACAGGYNIFPFGDGSNFPVSKKPYTLASACTTLPTQGSAKHIATNGSKIATIEYTNTTDSPRPAKISLWDMNWINGSATTTWDVDAFAPIDGKDVIAIDDQYVYSCQGNNGVAIYSHTGALAHRFIVGDYATADKGFTPQQINAFKKSAANGLCVYGKYVFIANGGAGIWVLDKSDNFKVVGHFTDTDKYMSLEQNKEIGASANYVRVTDDGYVYVAYGLAGVMVFKLNQ